MEKISLSARKEMLEKMKSRYKGLSWNEKQKVIDGLCSATGYERKYAITILNKHAIKRERKIGVKNIRYTADVQKALITIWEASNQICSKRLVPFLPEMIAALERHNHLFLPVGIRNKLLKISSSTMDRLLQSEKKVRERSISTTRSGSLLKKQIKVRTFSDWNEGRPGFFEIDLVSHCGESSEGSFLNTLVLTDIASGWIEFIPIIRKSGSEVIKAITTVEKVLPFLILGLDSDNGTEFINYDLFGYCETKKITFTRSRAYRKNDQAHVEEKNGSIIRRIIGYDRYEGQDALNKLTELYSVLRLYVNFFQPSVKLLSKQREGSKVSKKYDGAKTPAQRIQATPEFSKEVAESLQKTYLGLDPIFLLRTTEKLQNEFWGLAWKKEKEINAAVIEEAKENQVPSSNTEYGSGTRFYRRTKKPRVKNEHIWRTRKDPFTQDWDSIKLKLELNLSVTAKNIFDELIQKFPDRYQKGNLRTLQRRIKTWRENQIDQKFKYGDVIKFHKTEPKESVQIMDITKLKNAGMMVANA